MFTGVAAAFTVHVAVAIAAGSLLALLPHRLAQVIIGALFLLGAVLLLRGRRGHGEEHLRLTAGGGRKPSFARVASTNFFVILAAEFGDLTQIVTANPAARYHDPVSVGAGAVLGLWAVAALAIAGGRGLLRLVPITAITLISAIHGPARPMQPVTCPDPPPAAASLLSVVVTTVTASEGTLVQQSRVSGGGPAQGRVPVPMRMPGLLAQAVGREQAGLTGPLSLLGVPGDRVGVLVRVGGCGRVPVFLGVNGLGLCYVLGWERSSSFFERGMSCGIVGGRRLGWRGWRWSLRRAGVQRVHRRPARAGRVVLRRVGRPQRRLARPARR